MCVKGKTNTTRNYDMIITATILHGPYSLPETILSTWKPFSSLHSSQPSMKWVLLLFLLYM